MRRYVRPQMQSSAIHNILRDHGIINPWSNEDVYSQNFNKLPPYFRCTLQAIPRDIELQLKCKIPLAIVAQPACVDSAPVLDFSKNAIPRCSNCSAYLSCFCELSKDQKKWKCALCSTENEFSQKYLSSTSRFKEFSTQVYDLKAPHTYVQRQQVMKSYLFMIDVSKKAVSSGFTRQFAESLASQLHLLPDYCSITIITYDKYVTIYDPMKFRETRLIEPASFKVPPNYIGVLCKCFKNVEAILKRIAAITPECSVDGNCYGSALAVATSALRVYGGVIIASCNSRPCNGSYSISERFSDNEKDEVSLFHMPTGTEENVKVNERYQKLTLKMNKFGISLHLFAHSETHMDLSVIAMPCGLTGGNCHFYRELDSSQLHVDLFSTLSDEYLWDCSMKLRCSEGIAADKVLGNLINSNETLYFPVLSKSSTLAFNLKVWKPVTHAIFQAALVWSEGPGKRYVRVFNFSIPVTDEISTLSSSVDEQALSAYMLKVTATNLINLGGKKSKELLLSYLKGIVTGITGVKSFPFFMYSLMMHKLIEDCRTSKTDERMAEILKIRRMSVPDCLLYLYPKLIDVKEKKVLYLSKDNIKDGIFAMQEQSCIYVWGYPKEHEEEAKSMVSDDGRAQGELVEIADEMMSITGRYIHTKFLTAEEGSKYANERMIEDNKSPNFIDWVKETWIV